MRIKWERFNGKWWFRNRGKETKLVKFSEPPLYEGGHVNRTCREVVMYGFHATYLRYFNGVDVFNKLAFGNHSLIKAWKTKKCTKRFFAANVAMAETNAYLAYRKHGKGGNMERHEWHDVLSEAMMTNCIDGLGVRTRSVLENESHTHLEALGRNTTCLYCTASTKLGCNACYAPLCSPNRGHPCFAHHVLDAAEGTPLARANSRRVRRHF